MAESARGRFEGGEQLVVVYGNGALPRGSRSSLLTSAHWPRKGVSQIRPLAEKGGQSDLPARKLRSGQIGLT